MGLRISTSDERPKTCCWRGYEKLLVLRLKTLRSVAVGGATAGKTKATFGRNKRHDHFIHVIFVFDELLSVCMRVRVCVYGSLFFATEQFQLSATAQRLFAQSGPMGFRVVKWRRVLVVEVGGECVGKVNKVYLYSASIHPSIFYLL